MITQARICDAGMLAFLNRGVWEPVLSQMMALIFLTSMFLISTFLTLVHILKEDQTPAIFRHEKC